MSINILRQAFMERVKIENDKILGKKEERNKKAIKPWLDLSKNHGKFVIKNILHN